MRSTGCLAHWTLMCISGGKPPWNSCLWKWAWFWAAQIISIYRLSASSKVRNLCFPWNTHLIIFYLSNRFWSWTISSFSLLCILSNNFLTSDNYLPHSSDPLLQQITPSYILFGLKVMTCIYFLVLHCFSSLRFPVIQKSWRKLFLSSTHLKTCFSM